jgi:hypothetical protein
MLSTAYFSLLVIDVPNTAVYTEESHLRPPILAGYKLTVKLSIKQQKSKSCAFLYLG